MVFGRNLDKDLLVRVMFSRWGTILSGLGPGVGDGAGGGGSARGGRQGIRTAIDLKLLLFFLGRVYYREIN